MAAMIEYWLNMPPWLIFVTLAAGFAFNAFVIFALCFCRKTRPFVLGLGGVVPPYVNVLAALLALLTAFVASDTWDHQKRAIQTVQSEADHVLAVYDLSIAAPSDMSQIRGALRKYVAAVLDDGWPKMADGLVSAKADEALTSLLTHVAEPRVAAESGAPTQAALLAAVQKIRSDRGMRLALNEHEGDHSKWLVLLILGTLTQCVIGLLHLERPRAQAVALTIFTFGMVSTLGLIAEHEWPFDGASPVQPTALRQANVQIWKGGVEFTVPAARQGAPEASAPPQNGRAPAADAPVTLPAPGAPADPSR